jgi:hypothetical protein
VELSGGCSDHSPNDAIALAEEIQLAAAIDREPVIGNRA